MTDLYKLLEEGKIQKALTAASEDEDLWEDLIGYLEISDENIQRAAFEVVAKVGDHPELIKALPMLISGLESDDEVICQYAAEALYHLGADAAEALDSLANLLEHDDSEVRRTVAKTLGVIGPAVVEIKEILIDALADSDEFVRGEAALAITNIDSNMSEAVPHLVRLLIDEEEFEHDGKNTEVRNAAQKALEHIGPDAVTGLLEALREDRVDHRVIALTTLSQINPLPEEAIKDIEDALQDPDEAVQEAAKKALNRIKKEAKET